MVINMRENEIKELYEEISKETVESSSLHILVIPPKSQNYDSKAEGFKLSIEQASVKESSRKLLESIVEKHNSIRMVKIDDNFVIYTPRK